MAGRCINSAMAIELDFSRETLGLITSFYIIMSGLPGPVVAMAVNRFGVRRTLIAGQPDERHWRALHGHGGEFRRRRLSRLRAGGRWRCLHRRGHCEPDRACRAGSCGAARLAMSILYSSGAIGGFFATKFILPWAMIEGGAGAPGWWVIVTLSALAGVLALLFVRERPEDMGLSRTATAAALRQARPAKAAAGLTSPPRRGNSASVRPAYLLAHRVLAGRRQRRLHAVPRARHRARCRISGIPSKWRAARWRR